MLYMMTSMVEVDIDLLYFIYPTALGDLNSTKVNNLEWNDWVLVKRDFINVNGVSIQMNIYRGFNKINGALTINWG